MATKDPRFDSYINNSADFARPVLKQIRRLVHVGCPDVEETLKWGMPHFMYKGILCGMAAFKQHCTFGFWKGALIFKNDKNAAKADEAMGNFGRLTSISDLPDEKTLLGYIKEAVRLNEADIKVPARSKPKTKKELLIPAYFTSALKKDAKALTTFQNFNYSHKKEYVEWVTEARTADTRNKRLATTIQWLAEGKPRHWKYAGC